MDIIHRHYAHPDTLSTQDGYCRMLHSVEQKLASAIEVFGFTSYADAKAFVKQQTTAGAKVWEELDAKYRNRMKP